MTDRISNAMLIAMIEAEDKLTNEDATFEENLNAAMLATRNHWMCADKNEQFQAAVGAVASHYGRRSDEYTRLKREMKILRGFNKMIDTSQTGVPVDWDFLITDDEFESVGLMQLWRETQ